MSTYKVVTKPIGVFSQLGELPDGTSFKVPGRHTIYVKHAYLGFADVSAIAFSAGSAPTLCFLGRQTPVIVIDVNITVEGV